ncbi:hypothetical protein [Alicyclobacillus sp. TC]|uniref:hypothetical protein n=1 Tax=Alicyclobacillus sp. TC TaxID=2606450 RepID=UPI001EE43FB9|nr:hypothetical protein [Alicyclobacillus sp. TC]
MRIPDPVRNELIERVFRIADDEGYMLNNRVENTRFMDRLVADPEVGGVLLRFMEEEKVRTYIKDGILNQYTKSKRTVTKEGLRAAICDFYNEDCALIGQKNDVYVFRMTQTGKTLVVATGTFVKWETALRKVLLHIGATPLLQGLEMKKMLVILTGGVPLPAGDEEILQRSLLQIGVDVLVL